VGPLPRPWWVQEPIETEFFFKHWVYPLMAAHQRAILVPGLFSNDTSREPNSAAVRELQVQRMTAKFNGYWAWAQADTRVHGLNPYHYGREAHRSAYGQGAEHFPKLVRRMAEVGAIIKASVERSGVGIAA
jgi:hypothetical protein